jgi:hypothetical protein
LVFTFFLGGLMINALLYLSDLLIESIDGRYNTIKFGSNDLMGEMLVQLEKLGVALLIK